MQNIFREFAWRMLCSIEIILNKIHETLFFHQSATYWGHWSWPSRFAHFMMSIHNKDFTLIQKIVSLKGSIFRNYCMWTFLFYKKLHMAKLSMKVKLIPLDKPFCDFWLLAFIRNTTFSVAFCSLYKSVIEEIRNAMSIKHPFIYFKWLNGTFISHFHCVSTKR